MIFSHHAGQAGDAGQQCGAEAVFSQVNADDGVHTVFHHRRPAYGTSWVWHRRASTGRRQWISGRFSPARPGILQTMGEVRRPTTPRSRAGPLTPRAEYGGTSGFALTLQSTFWCEPSGTVSHVRSGPEWLDCCLMATSSTLSSFTQRGDGDGRLEQACGLPVWEAMVSVANQFTGGVGDGHCLSPGTAQARKQVPW